MRRSFPNGNKRKCYCVLLVLFATLLFGSAQALIGEQISQLRKGNGQMACKSEGDKGIAIPVLMYHHISDNVASDTVISEERFAHQMQLLSDNGFHPVSLSQLIDYVENGVDLPEKPVVLTFDDGYYSNYEIAFPIIKKYGYPAAFFIIGSSFGHMQYYKSTEYLVTPHFGPYEARKMLESGLVTIQSHSYDMHQWMPYESGNMVRENMLQLSGESTQDYKKAIVSDYLMECSVLQSVGIDEVYAHAYPCGMYDGLLESIMRECGIKLSFTIEETKINVLEKGQNSSLHNLGRMNICEMTTDEQLLNYLNQSVS